MNYRAALFDMDGTVLCTEADLAAAMNYALEQTGHSCRFTADEAKYLFGSGVETAISRALAIEAGEAKEAVVELDDPAAILPAGISMEDVRRIETIYRPYYTEHCAEQTKPYDGILELLKGLKEAGIRTAVVSNKPDSAVKPLAETYFPGMFDLAIGEKAGTRRKPAPDMLLWAVEQLGCSVEEAVYAGDTEIDVQTARAAGMDCLCVDWGFRTEAFLRKQGAVHVIHCAGEMLERII